MGDTYGGLALLHLGTPVPATATATPGNVSPTPSPSPTATSAVIGTPSPEHPTVYLPTVQRQFVRP